MLGRSSVRLLCATRSGNFSSCSLKPGTVAAALSSRLRSSRRSLAGFHEAGSGGRHSLGSDDVGVGEAARVELATVLLQQLAVGTEELGRLGGEELGQLGLARLLG
jgi:hypothetical protein